MSGRMIDLPQAEFPVISPANGQNGRRANIPLAVSIAEGLEIPWELDFLPNGDIIFTERPGRIRLIDAKSGLLPQPLLVIPEVAHEGEGGLLGIALHPDFSRNRFVYVYYTYRNGGNLANQVARYRMQDRQLTDRKLIIGNSPGAGIHDGGRIKFGPDRLLYITTGDAADSDNAQDKNSLAGKILRLRDDGTVPADNPFPGSPVYSLGHRNPQGLAWDRQGRLWATEHGSSATDEVNLIRPGRNYGWPVIRGHEGAEGLERPVIHSGEDTWAPSGAAVLGDSLFFAGLRGQSLYELPLNGQPPKLHRHLNKEFGRLRNVAAGPDNLLYILTNNRDGRGIPVAGDDRIIRVNPAKLR